MITLLALALFAAPAALPEPHGAASPPQRTPASLEAACIDLLAPLSRQEPLAEADRTAAAQPSIDPILCAAIIAAKNAACCAVCKEEYPFEYIKSCGWSGGCARGECVCEHYPL